MFGFFKKPKKINGSNLVIISEFVDPAQNSTGYYWSKITNGLSEKVKNIYVICPLSSYKKVSHPSSLVKYIYFNDGTFNKHNLMSRLFGQLFLSVQFSKAIFSNVNRNDVVFSGTNPSFLLFFISTLKTIIGFKWVLLVHDIFPENLVAAKIVRQKGVLYYFAKLIFDHAYSKADTLIAIGRDMLELLSNKICQKNKIVYIPNWVDPNDIAVNYHDLDGLLPSHGWEDKVVFQFFGNLGRVQGIENLLAALEKVQNNRAAFIFIGSGSSDRLISEHLNNNPNSNILHITNLPFLKNNIGLFACDVSIVSLSEGMNGLGVPSKAYFSMAADKPLLVVTDSGSELHMLITEEPSIGWFCPSGDPHALAKLIDQICDVDLREMYGNPKSVLEKKYGSSIAIEKYFHIIQGLQSLVT